MREELYNAVKRLIEEKLTAVKYVDMWNQNVEFAEEEDAWPRPAVFIEFGTIEWRPFQGAGRRGSGTVRIHLVTDWNEGGYGTAFGLGLQLVQLLEGLGGDGFDSMTLLSTDTNHSHEEMLESIDTYAVRYLMKE